MPHKMGSSKDWMLWDISPINALKLRQLPCEHLYGESEISLLQTLMCVPPALVRMGIVQMASVGSPAVVPMDLRDHTVKQVCYFYSSTIYTKSNSFLLHTCDFFLIWTSGFHKDHSRWHQCGRIETNHGFTWEIHFPARNVKKESLLLVKFKHFDIQLNSEFSNTFKEGNCTTPSKNPDLSSTLWRPLI